MTAAQAPSVVPDPRPHVVEDPSGEHVLCGGRCTACGHAVARPLPRCPRCRGPVADERFGPEGAIWAVTVLHVPAAGRDAPATLAYVDLDDGPRLLAHLPGSTRMPAVGARVRLSAPTSAGDPAAEEVGA